ncbi:hypothetical protein JR316_0012667 [Psilocybe cubensis]|uniref:Uncharacterized protein n=2 Tax=Psilocybe cubensis TaxID=181762 RepID=A0A8H8CG99_PSICU|nr:hypothetical protein JR316_0012667 [Psilocybe cubensis]KAH9475552.1 hypothetical protein JR316_0012667 [Psilocybe cubensis]
MELFPWSEFVPSSVDSSATPNCNTAAHAPVHVENSQSPTANTEEITLPLSEDRSMVAESTPYELATWIAPILISCMNKPEQTNPINAWDSTDTEANVIGPSVPASSTGQTATQILPPVPQSPTANTEEIALPLSEDRSMVAESTPYELATWIAPILISCMNKPEQTNPINAWDSTDTEANVIGPSVPSSSTGQTATQILPPVHIPTGQLELPSQVGRSRQGNEKKRAEMAHPYIMGENVPETNKRATSRKPKTNEDLNTMSGPVTCCAGSTCSEIFTDLKKFGAHLKNAHHVSPGHIGTGLKGCPWRGCTEFLTVSSLIKHIFNKHAKALVISAKAGLGSNKM